MNELECIRAFVKVVEVGSFAEAARQTGTVKSVITKRVNQLEEHLELQLLQRSTRRLTITDGGADFYERCVHVLSELDQAKAAVSSVEWGLTGTFRVSCISSVTSAFLAEDLCEFQLEHPDLRVELQQHDRFCDPVQEGFDVCLQPSREAGGILEKVDILPLQRLLVATPDYVKAHGEPTTAEALKTHRIAHNNHVQPNCAVDFISDSDIRSVTMDPHILTNTIWLLRAAVMSHQYVAIMPVFFIEKELASGQLIPLSPNLRARTTQFSAFYRRSSFVSMKVRIFVNFLRRKYGEHPPWELRILQQFPELERVMGSGMRK
ncbi:LysR family transcriptional regulator [Pseudomaricurvus alkylphenolicus]|jgi:DNA-binding transcriptional LysR family regulator|uniref:LysR family transcriptional regulator n=1 Tax=Pseudomaricurvus alkylphenolicus TaxID=1306991 RepID=UPI001423142F|nr:LysR family transcriptional regulator [Pseudomaricurvus alkylphenolicus]NIB38535.1 LysR family transcriptional regulator [Pseudomaricurvus alkylphenolicus]